MVNKIRDYIEDLHKKHYNKTGDKKIRKVLRQILYYIDHEER